MAKSIAKIDLPPRKIYREGSFGSTSLGEHASTMELFEGEHGLMIEWDIPSLGETENIFLKFEGQTLVGYDGVASLPDEAAEFLRQQGYTVDI